MPHIIIDQTHVHRLHERYHDDPTFHDLVDQLRLVLLKPGLTVTDAALALSVALDLPRLPASRPEEGVSDGQKTPSSSVS